MGWPQTAVLAMTTIRLVAVWTHIARPALDKWAVSAHAAALIWLLWMGGFFS